MTAVDDPSVRTRRRAAAVVGIYAIIRLCIQYWLLYQHEFLYAAVWFVPTAIVWMGLVKPVLGVEEESTSHNPN